MRVYLREAGGKSRRGVCWAGGLEGEGLGWWLEGIRLRNALKREVWSLRCGSVGLRGRFLRFGLESSQGDSID